jgi:glycosyltransferase involved in cell wall biosynthesis
MTSRRDPLKVLVIIPALSPVYGGPSFSSIGLAEALGRRGLQVDVVTTNAAGPRNFPVKLHQWIAESTYRLRYFRRWGRFEVKFSPTLMTWLFQHVTDYDVVHGMSVFNFPTYIYCEACRWRDVPHIIHPQGMFEPWAMSNKGWKKKVYFRWLKKPQLERANVIHCLTKHEAESIAALGVTTPKVIVPNGINFESMINGDANAFFLRYPELANKTRLLFLHRVDPKKGLDILAKSFARLRNRFPNTHLIITGPDPTGYWSTASRFFESAGCAAAVTYTGIVTGQNKADVLAAADVFVAPSYSEGFSMSVLEAMAAGLPSVITTGCNFPEAAEAKVALEVPIDATAFAEALGRLIENLPAAREMGQRAREFIFQNYTWDQAARKTHEVYTAILDHEPIPYQFGVSVTKTAELEQRAVRSMSLH